MAFDKSVHGWRQTAPVGQLGIIFILLCAFAACGSSGSAHEGLPSGTAGSSGSGQTDGGETSSGNGSGSGSTSGGRSSSGNSGSSGGTGTSSGSSSSSGSSGSAIDASAETGTADAGTGCGAGDSVLAAAGVSEPTLPSAVCKTISATKTGPSGSTDTSTIQAALSSCSGKGAVKLVASGAKNAFLTGSLNIDSAILWVDTGVVLYAATGATASILAVTGTGSEIVGGGTIDGQGQTGYWNTPPGPALIQASGSHFVLYGMRLQNSPGYHVKVTGDHFVIWGNTLQTPSTTAGGLTPASAHNTDGIDPGEGTTEATTDGYIVCNMISVGDDHIAIKGGENGHVSNLVIAHNHFGAGHGMSIGSETGPGGVSNVQVYDLTIDGDVFPAQAASDANGIRVKSYQGAGGLVTQVTYQDICARDLANPILFDPNYAAGTAAGGGTPQFTDITIQDFLDTNKSSLKPVLTFDGYDSSHETTVTLNNVVVDSNPSVNVSNAAITIGSEGTNFTVPGATGSGTPQPIDCSSRFAAFPVTF